jgi:hypothetical protein
MDLTHLEHLPQHSQDCEAIYIHINNEFTQIVYDPIALQTEHSDSPSWSTALVELLQFVFRCKEWHHTIQNLSVNDFQIEQDLKFLIYTDDFRDSLDDSKKQHDSSSSSNNNSSAGQNSHVSNGK